MLDRPPKHTNLHALLIGVDHYLPNRLPDGGSYPSLGGCVRDIRLVEALFKSRFNLPDDRIIKLTSTPDKDGVLEPEERWPTYENIVAAFRQVTERAYAGDQVYVHYSGHGGRTVTAYEEIKGEGGVDESLVPMDIGREGARYLRDVEMAYLLKQMVEKGIVVTLVLDSCFSGEEARGYRDVAVRGISSIDTTKRPTDSLVATRDELMNTWQSLIAAEESTDRPPLGQDSSGWFPSARGFLLVAACQADELAYEYDFAQYQRNGVLTYWLVDQLSKSGSGLTYGHLYDRLVVMVHSQFVGQTPRIEGETHRPLFGNDGGEAIDLLTHSQIEPSELANLAGRRIFSLSARVRLVRQSEDALPPDIDQESALERLEESILNSPPDGFLSLATDDMPADFQVAVNREGEYEIWDAAGCPIPNLVPAQRVNDEGAAVRVAQRLTHLTRSRNVLQFENPDPAASLSGQIIAELFHILAIRPGLYQLIGPLHAPRLDVGEELTLRIRNSSSRALNIAVLILQPDWSMRRLYPVYSDSEVLDSKKSIDVPMKFDLPPGYKDGRITIKVFAAADRTSLQWLELPPLDHPIPREATRRSPATPLEELMWSMAETPSSQRRVELLTSDTPAFTTAQVEIQVQSLESAEKHIQALSEKFSQLYSQGRYGEAVEVAAQGRDLARRFFGSSHPHFASALSSLGLVNHLLGRFAKAESLFLQSLDVYRSRPGENDEDLAATLNNLAELYRGLGRFTAAEPLYREAIEIYRAHEGEGSEKQTATTMNNLGLLYTDMGDYAKSEGLLLAAQSILREALGEDHLYFAGSLSNLAGLYRLMGRYGEAEVICRKALKIYSESGSEKHPSFGSTLAIMALTQLATGNYRAAETMLEQAGEVMSATLGEKHPYYAQVLNNKADLYRSMGEYERADSLYSSAMEIWSSVLGEAHPRLARALDGFGNLSFEEGLYRSAEVYFRRALEIRCSAFGESHVEVAQSLINLGRVSEATGDYARAREMYEQALELQRRAFKSRHAESARTLRRLAHMLISLQESSGVREMLVEALAIYRETLGEKHLEVAACLVELVDLCLYEAHFDEAERLCMEALAIRREALGEDHHSVVETLNRLADIMVATGRAAEAERTVRQAATIEDRIIQNVFPFGPEHRRNALLQSVETSFHKYLSILTHAGQPSSVRDVFDLVLRRKAIRTELLSDRREMALLDKYSEQLPINELIEVRKQIAWLVLHSPEGTAVHHNYQGDLERLYSSRARLEAELARQIPELDLALQLRSVDCSKAARVLPDGAVLIEFVRLRPFDLGDANGGSGGRWNPARYIAFMLPAGAPDNVQMADLGEAEEIDRALLAFRSSVESLRSDAGGPNLLVSSGSGGADPASGGVNLRERLFDPLVSLLGDHRYLVIAPDAELIKLPFGVLPGKDGGYLTDTYHIAYLSTGRDALRFDVLANAPSTEPLVIADPDFEVEGPSIIKSHQPISMRQRKHASLFYDAEESERRRPTGMLAQKLRPFLRLPGTQAEGRRIAAMLGVRPLTEDKALKVSVKSCQSPRILHVAAPGFFIPSERPEIPGNGAPAEAVLAGAVGADRTQQSENPLLRSGLALAGANAWLRGGRPIFGAEDGLLTADEILGCDLIGTRLVVLSACNLSTGDMRVSDAVAGFQRAFLLAGARAVVMNLWQAPDDATTELMEEFYRRVGDGEAYAQALQHAQFFIRKKYPSPFYWASFICLADLSPLPVQTTHFVEAISPYTVGGPAPKELFVGRRDILKKIQDNLAPSAGKNILVLRGQRRTGKTSVLYRLRDSLPEESNGSYLPVLIDMQGMMGIEGESEFYFRLARDISRDLRKQGMDVPRPQLAQFEKSPSSIFEYDFLEPITDTLTNKRILLMLDEFDMSKELIDRGTLGSDVLDFFRHLMQHTPVIFLIAGTQKLRELTGGYYSVFFNLSVPIDIGTLSEEDTRWLITEPIRNYYKIESSAISEIVRVAGCHPYFSQLVCQKLLEVRNELKLNVVGMSHVAEAVDRALESGDDQIGYPWTEVDCSMAERLVLSVMARAAKSAELIPDETIRQRLKEADLNIPLGSVVKRLEDRGIISSLLNTDNLMRYRFVVPMLQKWIEKKRLDDLAAAQQYNAEHPTA